MVTLSAREVLGLFLGPVRSDTVSSTARHRCDFLNLCFAQALNREVASPFPSTDYTLKHIKQYVNTWCQKR